MRALLIHSPLVGPATLMPLAAALEGRGWSVGVPDLRDAIASPSFFASRAAAQPTAEVVVGHSGAGPFVPSVTAAVAASTMVFVDAIVPPAERAYEAPASLRRLLDSLPMVDGLLPAWDEWWPPELLGALVPDDALRATLIAEMPRIPRSFFDAAVPLPEQWWSGSAAYLQLSPTYDEERARAEALGWPTRRLDGGHLDTATNPLIVAAEIGALITATPRADPPLP